MALYVVNDYFRGKLGQRFVIEDIPLLIFKKALSTCCLKVSFSLSKCRSVFDKTLFPTEY